MGIERVQLIKQESAALGGDAADETDYPSPLNSAEDAPEVRRLYLQDGVSRDEETWVSREGDDLTLRDKNNPNEVSLARALAAGLAGADGPWLVALSGAFKETLPYGSIFPTQSIWWTDNTKTKKIAEKLILAGGGIFPTQIRYSTYAADGTTVIAQITDTINRVGIAETDRTRTVV